MKFGSYRITCRFTEPAILPPFKGSTFRGGFGHALKKAVCIVRHGQCADCLLHARCLYARVFEPQSMTGGNESRTATLPHPYVIEPDDDGRTRYAVGDTFSFRLLLFGEYTEYLPYFVYAMQILGELGVGKRAGKDQGRFELMSVESGGKDVFDSAANKLLPTPVQDLDLCAPMASAKRVTVKLHTPLRLKFANQLRAELPFHLLVRTMLRRISMTFETFGEGEPTLDYRGLVRDAERIEISENDLRWFDIKRYSSRQEQEMLMGGMIGSICYRGDLTPYLPLLEMSSVLHLGKQTAFGLGQISYVVEAL